MKKGLSLTSENLLPRNAHLLGVSPFERLQKGKAFDAEKLSVSLAQIQNKINEGLTTEAEKLCFEILENYSNSLDVQAQLNQLVSIAYSIEGRFEEALEVLKPFENQEVIQNLKPENLAIIYTQQAISYTNLNDFTGAISLLNMALRAAEDRELNHLLTNIYLAFARVYREQNEYAVSRNYAEKAMKFARDLGDWRGLAESYRIIATSYQQEGTSQKAIELFQQSVKIIGERSVPYLLGKIHSDISGAYLGSLRPQDGVDSLKKAIAVFEKIEQKFQTAIAYNHLGVNLLLSGDWKKAEEIVNRAVDLALEINHAHLSIIVCSVGELNFLRGDYVEAEKLFMQAIELAEEKKKERFVIQGLYGFARCLLARGEYEAAIFQSSDTVERCQNIKENNVAKLANLVLAEAYLKKRKTTRADNILQTLEKDEVTANYLVLGNIARIRALMALASQDEDLTLHHLNRSHSIFEMAGDLYQSALINYEIGKTFIEKTPDEATQNLRSASKIFRQIGADSKAKLAEGILTKLNKKGAPRKREQTLNFHLLMLRLVEAVASRDLLLRELMTVLRQDSKSKRILLAEVKEGRKAQSSIIDGFTITESAELITKVNQAIMRQDLETFAQEKNLSLFQLRAPHASPAILLISPASSATLSDGSSIQPLLQVVELGMEVCALREHSKDSPNPNITNVSPLTTQGLMPGFIHSSPAMMELVDEILKISTSDVTSLITGESGSGKELIARAIHIVSRRKDKVFIPFNCTAVPRELTEGHLFGYKKGSFTGAIADSEGMIRAADGGTLFLDEIGDLPLDVQPKILRFLQEGEVQPLGEKSPKLVDVRIIAATNMNLEEKVSQGLFREDLYYRLNVIRMRVPPLRDRRSEIPQLVNHYINHYSAKFGRQDLTMSSETMDLLIAFNWKGNVRQLCNEVQRIVARSDNGDLISPQHLSPELRPTGDSSFHSRIGNAQATSLNGGGINVRTEDSTLEEIITSVEIQLISNALERHNNNISQAAKDLGLTRRGLYLKMDRYQLRPK